MPSQKDGMVRPAMAPISHGDVGGAAARLRHQAAERHRQHRADEEREEGELQRRPRDAPRSRRPPAGRSTATCRDRRAAAAPSPGAGIARRWAGRGRCGARSSAIRSGVTSVLAPSMIATASPGIRRIIRKTMTETPNSTTTRSIERVEGSAASDASHRSSAMASSEARACTRLSDRAHSPPAACGERRCCPARSLRRVRAASRASGWR